MSVAQTAAALVSRNIANAQTPGYAREVLPIATALGGLGVTSGPPTAMRAVLLEKALQAANGRVGYHEGQVPHLTLAEEAVNDLDGIGLGPSLEDFRTAIAALAANPSGETERRSLMTQARSLGAAFSSTRRQLDDAGDGVARDAVAVSNQVSNIATQIAMLDQRIRSARAGEEVNSYLSQRSALVSTLSGLVDVEVRTGPDGTLAVSTAGGRSLVEGGIANRMIVEISGPPARSLAIRFERSDGTKLEAIAGSEFGGKLGGLLAAHEATIMPALQDLDALAFDFMNTFNAAHAAGFDVTGAPGGDFFTAPTSVEGAASHFELASGLTPDGIAGALDPSLGPGDNSNLLLLADIAGDAGALSSGASVPATWRGISTSVSQALANATSGGEFELASKDQLENLLAAENGVSIDEEMFNLTQAQTALEASSKVIGAAQLMTDTVLSLVG